MKKVKEFIADETAQSTVEYALVALVLAAASYGAIKLFASAWAAKYNLVKKTRSGPRGSLP